MSNISEIDQEALIDLVRADLSMGVPFKHGSFCHYTTSDAANSILESGMFYATNLRCSNDLNERERHRSANGSVHSISLCNSKTESIPLWYLYAGLDGKGVRLRITSAKLWQWINSNEVIYRVKDGNPDYQKPLRRYVDYDIFAGWVCYRDQKNAKRILVRNKQYLYLGDWETISLSKDVFLIEDFIKDYEWAYEKEFRIVFRVHKNEDRIAVPIDVGMFSIMFAPEIQDKEEQLKRNGFLKWIQKGTESSCLSIRMDLENRFKKGKG